MANIFLSVPILGKPELRMIYSTYKAILSSGEHKVRIYFNKLKYRKRNRLYLQINCKYGIPVPKAREWLKDLVENPTLTNLQEGVKE